MHTNTHTGKHNWEDLKDLPHKVQNTWERRTIKKIRGLSGVIQIPESIGKSGGWSNTEEIQKILKA